MSFLDHIRRVEREAELLHTQPEVEAAIGRVAQAITRDLADRNPVIVTVLNGGIIFCGQLLTRLSFPLELDAVSAGRYRGETHGSHIRWALQPSLPLRGRIVLLVDDILDEGITLAEIKRYCEEQDAANVLIAVLINKRLSKGKPIRADYVGLETDDRYLFGYGMDYRNYLRNAAGIYACRESEIPPCA